MSDSTTPDKQFPQAPPRRARVGLVVPLVLLAGAVILLSQVKAVASFSAVFWIAGLALLITALTMATKEWRLGRHSRR